MNENFKKNPNLKYRCDIVRASDIIKKPYTNFNLFEAFKSYKDNKEYLASPNNKNFNLDIYELYDNKKILSLKGHEEEIKIVNYFINSKDHNEYLVSVEKQQIIIIWDITNNYNLKYKINNKYSKLISCCILIFPHNQINNYMVENTTGFDIYNARLYSLEDGKMIKKIKNPSNTNNPLFYIISWLNKKDDQYYLIRIGFFSIIITNLLNNKIYYEYKDQDEIIHNIGYVYENDGIDYLYCLNVNGQIIIIDLMSLSLIKKIYIPRINVDSLQEFENFTLWNNKYIIFNYKYHSSSYYIFDLKNDKIISKIMAPVLYIKKIYHSTYGESLLIGSSDIIQLWSV